MGMSNVARISWHSCQPSILGIMMSMIARLTLTASSLARASCPSAASTTSKPSFRRNRLASSRIWGSSSTTRILLMKTFVGRVLQLCKPCVNDHPLNHPPGVKSVHPSWQYHKQNSKPTYEKEFTVNTLSNSLTRERVGENVIFSAPLGDLKTGRLEVTSGVANLELYGDRSTRDLFHAEFRGLIPDVRVRNERVSLHYHFGLSDMFQHVFWGHRDA